MRYGMAQQRWTMLFTTWCEGFGQDMVRLRIRYLGRAERRPWKGSETVNKKRFLRV